MFNKRMKNYSSGNIGVNNLPYNIAIGKSYSIEQAHPNYLTHRIFKYPCRFIPEIPKWAIQKYLGEYGGSVLDPFSGSGTTLIEGIVNRKKSFGMEIDKFAKKLIKVKTTQLKSEEFTFIENWLDYLVGISKIYFNYPDAFIPSITNLEHWFSYENILKLGLIKREIEKIDNININDFLLICFAGIIRKASRADDVSPKPYVSSRIIKKSYDPFDLFFAIVNKYMDAVKELSEIRGIGKMEMLDGDALNIESNFIADIAITSPPYINAFDYPRTLRLENLWLGLETEDTLRSNKKLYVGTENIKVKDEINDLRILENSSILKSVYGKIKTIDQKRALIVKKFFEDMSKNLSEVSKVLQNNGRYCIVIGNSKIRDVNVESWKIISQLAVGMGYEVDTFFSYAIHNPYLRIPRSNKGGVINEDHVLILNNKV